MSATTGGPTVSTRRSLFPRLSAMMLLEYLVFGSWYATAGLVLVSYGMGGIIGVMYSLGAVAAIVSPLFLGALADRYLPSQRVLAIAHLVGGVVMLFIPLTISAKNSGLFLLLVFVYMLFFQPTVAITNNIGFHHLGTNSRIFPYIRVFGTIGWIVAGLAVGQTGLSASTGLFFVTAAASIVLGVYSFTLPGTPAPQRGTKFRIGDVVGAQAFTLFRRRNFIVFAICGLLTSIPISMYNGYASTFLSVVGIKDVASVLTIGQMSEIVFIALIPVLLKRLGMKWMLIAGMAMWTVRYLLFVAATGSWSGWAVVAVALHGICNDFFLINGFMYVERIVSPAFKAQAQSLFVLITQGVGTVLGSLIGGWIYNGTVATAAPAAALSSWIALWIIPAVIAAAASVGFIALFHPKDDPTPAAEPLAAPGPTA
jgi:nucleoside transporter